MVDIGAAVVNATELLELTPEQIAKLKSQDIPVLVSAAVKLDRTIKEQQKTLACLKERLVTEGEADAKKAEVKTPGTTWNYTGPCGNRASVAFPEDKLIGAFWIANGKCFRKRTRDDGRYETVEMANVKEIAGVNFKKLFFQMYKPAKAFRELLKALATPKEQEELTEACQEPSSPRVSFETKAESGK